MHNSVLGHPERQQVVNTVPALKELTVKQGAQPCSPVTPGAQSHRCGEFCWVQKAEWETCPPDIQRHFLSLRRLSASILALADAALHFPSCRCLSLLWSYKLIKGKDWTFFISRFPWGLPLCSGIKSPQLWFIPSQVKNNSSREQGTREQKGRGLCCHLKFHSFPSLCLGHKLLFPGQQDQPRWER